MTTNVALLLVEDDPSTLELSHGIMSRLFPTIDIHTAANPEEALDLFEQHQHHIVVTDNRMPDKDDGIQLVRKICEGKRETVIILVSADDLTDALERAPEVEVSCVLKKPVDLRALRDNVRDAITAIIAAREMETRTENAR